MLNRCGALGNPMRKCCASCEISSVYAGAKHRTEFTFNWTKPGFPGTVVAGKFLKGQKVNTFTVYAQDKHKEQVLNAGRTAARQFEFMTQTFGQPETAQMQVVELPDDSVSAIWAPGILAIAGSRLGQLTGQFFYATA